MRVSVAALVSIEIDGSFLLVQQKSRNCAQYGPIGGAVEALGKGIAKFKDLGLVFEGTPSCRWGIERVDLRGQIQVGQLRPFCKQIVSGYWRESFRECAEREVYEELVLQAGIKEQLLPKFRRFRRVAAKMEGPFMLKGKGVLQWRYFVIYRLDLDTQADRDLIAEIKKVTSMPSSPLLLATYNEISEGWTFDKHIIGDHAEYLIREKPNRSEVGR